MLGPNNVGSKTLVLRPTKFDALDALPRESTAYTYKIPFK
jgi:hypothetical protein